MSAQQEQWRERYEAARAAMRARRGTPGALIEVAAQHPLAGGVTPGVEFAARLERGAELYRQLRAGGERVEVYVPGSRHRAGEVDDAVSLSAAGTRYLREAGLPAADLHGDDLNARYKGAEGVFGSADECFVAARYFLDAGFGRLYSVCSPSQLMRKTLHYIAFGVVPLNVTAPVDEPFHDYLYELFEAVPHVLGVDGTLQGPGSREAERLRRERRPST
ncbi:hypothetical protein [Dactylosporangium sp. CS-033363]|uniref:hypothetical protein n=1 Tax=Dactylosporangium sp. CS-033363 TaxID=3239935 RepID=UPI003D90012D